MQAQCIVNCGSPYVDNDYEFSAPFVMNEFDNY